MRFHLLLFSLTVLLFQAKAQDYAPGKSEPIKGSMYEVYEDNAYPIVEKVPDSIQIFHFAQEMPVFPGGGDTAFYSFIKKNLVYSAEEKQKVTKPYVYVEFIIEKDGCPSSVRIVKGRELSPALDQAAINVVTQSPQWTPGKMNGRIVRVKKVVRVRFD